MAAAMFLAQFHLLPSISYWLGIVSLVLAVCALLGTLYAVGFAVIGIVIGWGIGQEKNDRNNNSLSPAFDDESSTVFLVLIPAHQEGAGLIPTVEGVLNQKYPRRRVHCVVIADNCTDDTAAVAAAAGAEVLIRTDPAQRGKGHALAWAFGTVQDRAWDAACVLDADSVVAPNFLAALDLSIRRGELVVQSRSEFVPPADPENWHQMYAALSKAAELSFMYRSRERLGLMLLLQGNGFCIARSVVERVPWQAHSIVEDAEYALILGKQGIQVHYQEHARVWSRQASTVRDLRPQRVRWASGTWQLFRQAIPALLGTALRRRSAYALEAILMLLMTSRILLIYLVLLSFLLSFAAAFSVAAVVWGLLAGVVLFQFLYIVLMFRFASDRPAPLAGVLRLPYYVAVIASAQVLAIIGINRRVWWRTSR